MVEQMQTKFSQVYCLFVVFFFFGVDWTYFFLSQQQIKLRIMGKRFKVFFFCMCVGVCVCMYKCSVFYVFGFLIIGFLIIFFVFGFV